MYIITKNAEPQHESTSFMAITNHCINNRMVLRGLKGCTILAEGVEIWWQDGVSKRLVKTWRKDEPKYKTVR